MGNKGGVALRFQVKDTTLCFVNSHLGAYDDQVLRRNADYAEIAKRLAFPVLPSRPADVGTTAPPESVSIFDCDALFWLVSRSLAFRS